MKRKLAPLAVLITISLMVVMPFANDLTKTITARFNSVNLEVNGERVDADTLVYEGVTYVPLRETAEMLDKNVSYNSKTRTASIDNKQEVSSNMIQNPSVEVSNNEGLPENWGQAYWGEDLSCQFSYYKYGNTGDRSLRIDVDSYKNMGDAKWHHKPVKVNSGEWYEFSNFYRSNVLTTVTVKQLHEDGSLSYFDLANVSPSPDKWKRFSGAFYVPEGVKEITLYHLIRNVGYLITDDYKLDAYTPQSFDRALLTLTFDDGWEINYQTALPILQKNNIKSSQAYATKYINPESLDHRNRLRLFTDAGHEIESHSVNHFYMPNLSSDEVWFELEESQRFLREYLPDQEVRNFFSPFGSYNDIMLDMVHKLYDSHRSTDVGFNSKDNFDKYNVRVQNILSTTSAQQVEIWVEEALKTKTWLVLVYHRIADDPGYYDSYIQDFINQIEVIVDSGITILTYSDALEEIMNQMNGN